MAVKFIQCMFPDARRVEKFIDRSDEINRKARILNKGGWVFEIENNQGMIWMSAICPNGDDWNVDGLCENGPDVLNSVDHLVTEAWRVNEVVNGETHDET